MAGCTIRGAKSAVPPRLHDNLERAPGFGEEEARCAAFAAGAGLVRE